MTPSSSWPVRMKRQQGMWSPTEARVLTAVGLGADRAAARAAAYGRVEMLDFEGAEYRSDIGLEVARR